MYFVKVVEHRSFALAARELHVSQPSISNAIAKLEGALEIDLFVRHHAQGVSLTSAGGRLLPEVKALLAQAIDIESNAHELSNNITGRLHVGCFEPIASLFIPQLITEFSHKYTDVELVLYEKDAETLAEGLNENSYDMVITCYLSSNPTLIRKTIGTLKPYAILPVSHPLSSQNSVTITDLSKHSMVLLDLPRSRELISTLFERHEIQPSINIKCKSFDTTRALVSNGAGYSILMESSVSHKIYTDDNLVKKKIQGSLPSTNIYIAYPKRFRYTKLHNFFVEYCREYFAKKLHDSE